MEIWVTIGTFVGGIGLFLIGMHQMTEGLKVMAGAALRTILARSTKTRVRALFAGAGMTAIVQSSSAVTVATIGFVNAGLVDLGGALWLIFGSNVGTTATGWLVAATGLDVHLEVVALPAVGVGTLLSLTGGDGRRAAAGRALAGFGLFFLGLAIMSEAFRGVADGFDPSTIAFSGVAGVLIFLGVGILLTTMTQSSSAAIAVTLTAASTGVLPMSSAAAMVIGANLGTTTTAAFSVIGATPPAKRAAAGQVSFNILAAAVALTLLPFLLAAIDFALETTGEKPSPAVSLAAFHTLFNVLGVVVVWPLAGRMLSILSARFGSAEEVAQKPKYLDRNVLEIPEVALTAVGREIRRSLEMSNAIFSEVLEDEPPAPARVGRRASVVDQLEQAIGGFTGDLASKHLTPEAAESLRGLLRVVSHAKIIREQALLVATLRQNRELQTSPTVAGIRAATRALLAAVETDELVTVEELWEALEPRFDSARAEYITSAAAGARAAEQALFRERLLGEIHRGAKHVMRAVRDLPAPPEPPEEEPVEPPEEEPVEPPEEEPTEPPEEEPIATPPD